MPLLQSPYVNIYVHVVDHSMYCHHSRVSLAYGSCLGSSMEMLYASRMPSQLLRLALIGRKQNIVSSMSLGCATHAVLKEMSSLAKASCITDCHAAPSAPGMANK